MKWRTMDVDASRLTEVSGCAISRATPYRVWLHNDAGDGALVVPVDYRTGRVGTPVELSGVTVVDPEDLAATATGELVLGDIGDNSESRESIQLYRFTEPAVDATTAAASRVDLRYPDGPHNAEALVVSSDGTVALIVTKSKSGVAGVYRAQLNAATSDTPQVLTRVGTVTISGERHAQPNIVTAGDLVGSSIVLRTFASGYLLADKPGKPMDSALSSSPIAFSVPTMVQGEALCASADGTTLVTASEARGKSTFSMAVGAFTR